MIPAFLLNWRVLVSAGAGLAVLTFIAVLNHEKNRADDAEAARDEAQRTAALYQGQATLNQTAGTEAVKAEAAAVRVARKAEETSHAIQAAPGASQALPGPVRDEWLSALRVLRQQGYSVPFPADPGVGEPAPAMPPG